MEELHFVGTGVLKIDTIHQRNPSPQVWRFRFRAISCRRTLFVMRFRAEATCRKKKTTFHSPITRTKKKQR